LALVCGQHHGHPEQREPASAAKLHFGEPSFSQQLSECFSAPELYMASIPKGVRVRIPPSEDGKHKVFQVAMVRSGANETSSWTERCEAASGVRPWRVQVLNYFRAYDQIEWLLV
jgi:hypothetical protein